MQKQIEKEIIEKYILIMSLKEEMQELFKKLDDKYYDNQYDMTL